MKPHDRPRLRPLEAILLETDGRKMVCFRDPEGWQEDPVIVSPEAGLILSLCDGSRSLPEIREDFSRVFGGGLSSEDLAALLRRVEEHHLLEGEGFERYRREAEQAFLALDARPSSQAGKVFPDSGPELSRHLDAMISGTPDGGARRSSSAPAEMRAAISPHIDYARGARAYAALYRTLPSDVRSTLFVILGTVHTATRRIYTATRKHFETPLGPLLTDRAAVDRLQGRYGIDLFEDETAHRSEHSIELQAVLLRHLLGDRDLRMLPILCGSFHTFVGEGRSPMEDPAVAGFIEALRETLAEEDRRVFLLAAADLSHVGPRFGDLEPPTPESRASLEEADRRTIDFALRRDAEGFYRSVAEEGDRRKICGLSPIYTMLHLVEPLEGKLLHYGQAPDPAMPGVVSYASVAYYGS